MLGECKSAHAVPASAAHGVRRRLADRHLRAPRRDGRRLDGPAGMYAHRLVRLAQFLFNSLFMKQSPTGAGLSLLVLPRESSEAGGPSGAPYLTVSPEIPVEELSLSWGGCGRRAGVSTELRRHRAATSVLGNPVVAAHLNHTRPFVFGRRTGRRGRRLQS